MEKNDTQNQNLDSNRDQLPSLADDELSSVAGGFIVIPVNPVTGKPVWDPA
jgi:hypothetical protein